MFKCVSCFTTTYNLLQRGLCRCRCVYIDQCWLYCKWAVFGFVFEVIWEVRCTQFVLYSFLLPCVVLAVLCVVAYIYSFWHCCCSGLQSLAVSFAYSFIKVFWFFFFSHLFFCFVLFFFSWGYLLLLHLMWLPSSSEVVSVPRVPHPALSRVVLLSILEEVNLLEWLRSNGTMLDWWYTSESHAKTGHQELLSSLDCAVCLQWLSGMCQFQRLLEISCKWLVWSRNLAILVSIALLLLGHL